MTAPSPVPPVIAPPPPPTSLPLHTLPPPFSTQDLVPITQGAEALVYKTTFLAPHIPVVVKYRPPKPYRHPTLDRRLTKQRLLAEARSLVRVKREGVNVPGVLGADWEAGWLVLEFIEGGSVRGVLDGWAHGVGERQRQKVEGNGPEQGKEDTGNEGILDLMRRVGVEVGKLHELGVCHGDLTTSNIMLRSPSGEEQQDETQQQQQQQQQQHDHHHHPTGKQTPSTLREAAMSGATPPSPPLVSTSPSPTSSPQSFPGTIYLIDFGLTTSSIQDEDKAVDLYVLERAFAATHPAAAPLFEEVLRAYGASYKGGRAVLRRLEGVRGRGRKRSMLG